MERNCTIGNRCGRSCITREKNCYRSQGQELLPGPICIVGQTCGNACISNENVCTRGGGSAVYQRDLPTQVFDAILRNSSLRLDDGSQSEPRSYYSDEWSSG